MKIKLNKIEFSYLNENDFFLPKNQGLPNQTKKEDGYIILEISEDLADIIRDRCGERLQMAGFDNKYSLTKEGRILESLVDKFFIG